jgi:EAL domain-containing protein (putative c-di-GMP-specific phosphodiesterase class I)
MSRRSRWLRSLRRELQVLRRDNPRTVAGVVVLSLLASGGLAGWLWNSQWQEQQRQQLRQSETYRGLLDLRVTSHRVIALDWGHWDPLYRFAGGEDPGFVAREVRHSSIISDGQTLLIATPDHKLLTFPDRPLSAELQGCLRTRLGRLQSLTAKPAADQAYGFYCRGSRQSIIGAGTAILSTDDSGPVRGWLLHFSQIERPSYNRAVNAAFREISGTLTEQAGSREADGVSTVSTIGELLPPGQTFGLQPAISALQQRLAALQTVLLPWLTLNGLVLIGAGGTLLGLRRLRLNQRRSDWRNRGRLRQLRQALPGPLLSQPDLLTTITRDPESLGVCWIAALRVQVTMFSTAFSRSSAHTRALGDLGERLQRRRGTRCLALGEESDLLLVFQPTNAQQPEQELQSMATQLQELKGQLSNDIKLTVRGLITPLDRRQPRQQMADLALVLSLGGNDEQPLQFQPVGVAERATDLRQQLHIDFSVNQVVENLREHRYRLEPVLKLNGDQQHIAYSEMLFRLPSDMDQRLTVQEVILSLERNNNVHLIDQLMLRKAIELLRRSSDPALKLGINLSAMTFGSHEHFDELMAQLRTLPEPLRERLVLEVTETAIIEKPELWSVKLQQLRDFGVQIAIDDFGVGFASIAYLFRFKPDYLKLDLSYSQRLGDCNVDSLVDFLLTYADHNDCQLILEGIETEEQLEAWRLRGVSLFQGYLFHHNPGTPDTGT